MHHIKTIEILVMVAVLALSVGVLACDSSGGNKAAGGTDGTDGADATDGTDGADATDGTDGGDATDATDGGDATDAPDGTDETDGTDGSDGIDDTPDGTDAVDGTDGVDSPDGVDGTDEIDGVDGDDGKEGVPVVEITPSTVDFGPVSAGKSPTKVVSVTNTGKGDLEITEVALQGHPDYTVLYADNGVDLEEWSSGESIQFAPPLYLEPGDIQTFIVRYDAVTILSAQAKLIFYTTDPKQPTGTAINLKANMQGPDIFLSPTKVQFGGKLVGQKALLPVKIMSIGSEELVVTSIAMVAGSDADFNLDFSPLPGSWPPTPDKPLKIGVKQAHTFNVAYTPNAVSPVDEDGTYVWDVGHIIISSNAFENNLKLKVTGIGVDKECPTAVIVIKEGEEVIPQTNLHLLGEQSFAPAGAISKWKWSVKQPVVGASVFIPSSSFPNPTFEVNIAGTYEFSLDVWDEANVKSCVSYKQTVVVVPNESIHVELLWHTPGDLDETDQGPEAGSDMDLHFTHEKYAASGPDLDKDGKKDVWFDIPFDCFWFNAHPNWGKLDPAIDDNPGLDRDDTDGVGPENLNLNIPEDEIYRVGVHYWSDNDYGKSFATLRFYIQGALVKQLTGVEMVNHDMWDAATIDWPSGKITPVKTDAGELKITPDYQNTFFFQP